MSEHIKVVQCMTWQYNISCIVHRGFNDNVRWLDDNDFIKLDQSICDGPVDKHYYKLTGNPRPGLVATRALQKQRLDQYPMAHHLFAGLPSQGSAQTLNLAWVEFLPALVLPFVIVATFTDMVTYIWHLTLSRLQYAVSCPGILWMITS
ncbi:hypothetical protein KQX54_004585 [Cotesia glomerata]|uniref:Uncharacterized protein n=1 Tax=Cotesia glomerata TaxID=32391 RepID=A0AAV7IGA7_COTGL|nr:hypothetical protein KQX54_004585 [Cotesia glomerata]